MCPILAQSNSTVSGSNTGNNSHASGGFISLTFLVTGTCNGCSPDTPLLNSVSARRMVLQQSASSATTFSGFPSDFVTNCLCPVGAVIRGPTIQEFLQVSASRLLSPWVSRRFRLWKYLRFLALQLLKPLVQQFRFH